MELFVPDIIYRVIISEGVEGVPDTLEDYRKIYILTPVISKKNPSW